MHHCSSEPQWLEVQHGRWSSTQHSSRRAESGSYGDAQMGIRDPGGNAAWGHVLAGSLCLWQMLQPFTIFQTLRPNAVCSQTLSDSLATLWKLIGTETLKSHQSAKFSSSFSPQYPGNYYWFCRPLFLSPESTLHMSGLRVSTPPPRSKLSQNVPLFCPVMDVSRLQTPLPIQGKHQQLSVQESLAQTLPSHEHDEDPQRRLTYGRQKMLRLLTNVYSYLIEKASHSLPSYIFFWSRSVKRSLQTSENTYKVFLQVSEC